MVPQQKSQYKIDSMHNAVPSDSNKSLTHLTNAGHTQRCVIVPPADSTHLFHDKHAGEHLSWWSQFDSNCRCILSSLNLWMSSIPSAHACGSCWLMLFPLRADQQREEWVLGESVQAAVVVQSLQCVVHVHCMCVSCVVPAGSPSVHTSSELECVCTCCPTTSSFVTWLRVSINSRQFQQCWVLISCIIIKTTYVQCCT